MSRIAVLSDIHGNLPALDAVVADIAAEHVDEVLVGGDAHHHLVAGRVAQPEAGLVGHPHQRLGPQPKQQHQPDQQCQPSRPHGLPPKSSSHRRAS